MTKVGTLKAALNVWGAERGFFFVCVFVCVCFLFFFFPEMSVIIMKTAYTDYHRLCLSTSRLCD